MSDNGAPSAEDIIHLARKAPKTKALHLNVRFAGDDAHAFKSVQQFTPGLTDSQRLRDNNRLAAIVLALRHNQTPVKIEVDGQSVDLIEFAGVYIKE